MLHPLIEEALKLALYGMGTVFVFLTLLVFAIKSMTRALKKFDYGSEKGSPRTIPHKTKAAIVAAISQHKKHNPKG